MAKKNYNKISTEAAKANVEVETVETVEEPVTELVAKQPENRIVIGVVSNCTRLNVRYTPNIKSNVVKVLDAGTEVEIEDDERKDFYEVCAVAGTEYFHGFCMKKYITIKK